MRDLRFAQRTPATTFARRFIPTVMIAAATLAARAGDADPTFEAINRAIDMGVEWLKGAQKEDGGWGPCVGGSKSYDGSSVSPICYRLGPTAFSIYTLSVCGTRRDDAAMVRGVEWLRREQRDHRYTSYESAAIILMLTALNDTKAPASGHRLRRSGSRIKLPKGSAFTLDDWRWMDERVRHLVSCAAGSGGFGYGDFEPRRPDVSATQFAILALRAASFAGYPVEQGQRDIWTSTAAFLRHSQCPSGGFPYERGGSWTRGMTAAALSTLIICREQVALLGEKVPSWIDESIDKAMVCLDRTFDVTANPSPHFGGSDRYHYCHLYALERVGMLSGRAEFGGKGWYAQGARFLLDERYPRDGRWDDKTCMGPTDVLGTCFALLFLRKATVPVVTQTDVATK